MRSSLHTQVNTCIYIYILVEIYMSSWATLSLHRNGSRVVYVTHGPAFPLPDFNHSLKLNLIILALCIHIFLVFKDA